MNKVATGSLWATSLMLAGTLAGCGSGTSAGDSTTVTVARTTTSATLGSLPQDGASLFIDGHTVTFKKKIITGTLKQPKIHLVFQSSTNRR